MEFHGHLTHNIHFHWSFLRIPLFGKSLALWPAVFIAVISLLIYVQLDPYQAAETSSFNIHRKSTVSAGPAGAAVRERRFGTLSDITGES